LNHSRLKRLEEALQLDDAETPRPRLPATHEERRQMFAGSLPILCRDLFGPDDPRADPAHLADLTLEELRGVFREAMQEGIAKWRATNPPQREAFRRLPVSGKIRILRTDYRGWPAELQ
jgi:hypothetical protein